MARQRLLAAILAAIALTALGGAALGGSTAQTVGADVSFGGFDFGGGVAEDATTDTALTFAGTEFGPTDSADGAVVLPGFAVVALCLDDNDGLTSEREEIAGTNPCVYDTDEDGLADGSDVEFIQVAIAALPDGAFRADKGQGTRNAMLSILDAIERHLLSNKPRDKERSISELHARLDGCTSASGTADKNDWVIDCAAQLALRADLELLSTNTGAR